MQDILRNWDRFSAPKNGNTTLKVGTALVIPVRQRLRNSRIFTLIVKCFSLSKAMILLKDWKSLPLVSQELKGALSGLTQFLATESSLEMMKNGFYFTSKALFVLKIFKFLFWLFGHVSKRLDLKDKVNFKFYDVLAWLTNNYNKHIAPISLEVKTIRQWKFGQLIRCNMRNIFLEKSYPKCGGETSPRPFSEKLKLSISLDH